MSHLRKWEQPSPVDAEGLRLGLRTSSLPDFLADLRSPRLRWNVSPPLSHPAASMACAHRGEAGPQRLQTGRISAISCMRKLRREEACASPESPD